MLVVDNISGGILYTKPIYYVLSNFEVEQKIYSAIIQTTEIEKNLKLSIVQHVDFPLLEKVLG